MNYDKRKYLSRRKPVIEQLLREGRRLWKYWEVNKDMGYGFGSRLELTLKNYRGIGDYESVSVDHKPILIDKKVHVKLPLENYMMENGLL